MPLVWSLAYSKAYRIEASILLLESIETLAMLITTCIVDNIVD